MSFALLQHLAGKFMASFLCLCMSSASKVAGFNESSTLTADHSSPLEHWNRGFESHTRHGYLCAFVLCVGSGLATG
jgi:hypothetical protein